MQATPLVSFPPFRLDCDTGRLWRGTKPILLRRQTFAVLRYLVEHADRVVTKEDLLNALWPDVAVLDLAPMVCIAELRKALKDNPRKPRFIETVARRGYRFIAPVTATQPVHSPRPLFRNPQSTTNLVGREAELARLHRWLEKAGTGERQLVFVSGEPGIGKTALVDAFLTQVAGKDGVWIARGQCIEHYGAGEPYLPVLEALGRLQQMSDGECLKAVLDQHAPLWLAQLPAFLSAPDAEALRHRVIGATRERMLRELAEALEVLTAAEATHASPLLVLVLEDLHWSDSSTLELLAALAYRRACW